MFRLAGIFLFAPVFGSNAVPVRVKAPLAVVLAFCVYPMVPPQVPIELALPTMAYAVGFEMLIGLVIGYGAAIPLMGMQMGGVMIGQQLGTGMAQVFNPEFESETTVVGQMLFILALTLFLLLDGHRALVMVLVGSFQGVPLGGFVPDGRLLSLAVGLLASMFELAVRVAAPLLCLVFLETVAVGFLTRTMPQLNILSLSFPLRIMMGVAFVALLLTSMSDTMAIFLTDAVEAVAELFSGDR